MSSEHTASIRSFYSSTPAPASLAGISSSLHTFLSSRPPDAKVVAITSGGTRVPLEQNMVRFGQQCTQHGITSDTTSYLD